MMTVKYNQIDPDVTQTLWTHFWFCVSNKNQHLVTFYIRIWRISFSFQEQTCWIFLKAYYTTDTWTFWTMATFYLKCLYTSWQCLTHKTLKLKQLNIIQPSLISLFRIVLLSLLHVNMASVKKEMLSYFRPGSSFTNASIVEWSLVLQHRTKWNVNLSEITYVKEARNLFFVFTHHDIL